MTVINPGTLSKRKAPGTYARLLLYPPTELSAAPKAIEKEKEGEGGGNARPGKESGTDADGDADMEKGPVNSTGEGKVAAGGEKLTPGLIAHKVYERARVEVVRI